VSERVVRVTFRPLQRTGAPGQRREAVDSLIPRLVLHPNIAGVVPEASGYLERRFMHLVPVGDGAERKAFSTLDVLGAAPGWFAQLDVPILLGRDVTLADTGERVWPVVVGSGLAKTFWGGANPIGRTFSSPGSRDTVTMIVVGVYDARHTKTTGNDSLSVFTAHGMGWRRDALLVRVRGDAAPFLPELQRTIRGLAPGLPVSGMLTLAAADKNARNETLMAGALVGTGGAMALLLASLGLYGVIALAVRQRTREIGIRIALGANPVRVARMFLASGMRLGVIALAIGLPLSMVALHVLLTQSGFLASRVDVWLVAAGVTSLLLVVTAWATWMPARRAAAIDPALTLRTD
jgi:putative ABC transport system permease protein